MLTFVNILNAESSDEAGVKPMNVSTKYSNHTKINETISVSGVGYKM